MTIRVVELFSGIGAQAEALKELHLDYKVIATSDIDEHANIGYQAIHGDVNNLGDITKIEHLPPCDLITYSWPCQSVSIAGKREGMVEGSGTTSSLLWEVGRLITDLGKRKQLPEVLVAKNVDAVLNEPNLKNFNKWIRKLSSLGYTSSYSVMNAKDYGTPQNRKRLFMISTLHKGRFVFPSPKPDKRVMRDILEDEVDPEYFLSRERQSTFIPGTNKTEDGLILLGNLDMPGFDCIRRVYSPNGNSPTLPTNKVPKIMVAGSLGEMHQCSCVYIDKGLSPTITRCNYKDPPKILSDGGAAIRNLTPRECLRLQAFPDDAIDKLYKVLSKSAMYKVAGNSIAVCCLKAIFKGIYVDKTFYKCSLEDWMI